MIARSDILRSVPGSGQASIFYLGQEGFLIRRSGMTILFDPYLTDYVDRNFSTDTVVWKRRYPSPIRPEELDFIDFVFCSHAHGDHTDPETLSAIAVASPTAKFVGGTEVAEVFRKCGIASERIVPAKADVPLHLSDRLNVIPVPSAHEKLHPDGAGSYNELGFIVDLDGVRFYHAGDCCMYDGLAERVRGADVAFLPINGRDYFRTVVQDIIGNFDSMEAIRLAEQAGFSLLIPMHFDLYDVNCVNPAYFVDCISKAAPQQHYHLFIPGEKYIFEK